MNTGILIESQTLTLQHLSTLHVSCLSSLKLALIASSQEAKAVVGNPIKNRIIGISRFISG